MKYKCVVNYLVGFIIICVLIVKDVGGRPARLGRVSPLLHALQDIVNKHTPTKHTRDTGVCTDDSEDIMPILQLIKELVKSDIDYEKKLQKKANTNILKIPKKYFNFRVAVKPKYKKLLKLRKYHNKKIALGKEEAKISQKHNKHEYGLFEAYKSTHNYMHDTDSSTTNHQLTRETIDKGEFTESTTRPRCADNPKSQTVTESVPTSTKAVETATCPLITTTITEQIPTTTYYPTTENCEGNSCSTHAASTSSSQTSTENSTSTIEQSSYSTETSTSSITTFKQKDSITKSRLDKFTTEKFPAESETTDRQITITEHTKVTASITTEAGLTDNQTNYKHSEIYSTDTVRVGRNSIGHFSTSHTPPNANHSGNITSADRDFQIDTEFRENGSVLFEVPEDTRSFTHRCEGCSKSEHTTNGTGIRHGGGRLPNSRTESANEFTGIELPKLERDVGNQTEKFFEGEKFIDTGYGNIVVEAITLPEPLQSHGYLGKGVFGISQRDASGERISDRGRQPAQEHGVTEPSQIYTIITEPTSLN